MNDPESMRLLDRERVITAEEHERWFASLPARPTVRYFAVETEAGGHVGNVWLVDIDLRHRKAEVRILIGDHAARGHRLGAQALDLLAAEAFGSLGLHRLYAYVLAFNERGRRAFERAGFTLEATLREDRWSNGTWFDTWLLALVADGPPG